MIPIELRLAVVFLVGAFLGSLVNWAIYSLSWRPRSISPWTHPAPETPPRDWHDRLPVLGWLGLRREAAIHGRGFWIRPSLIELGLGVSLAWLYWWEVERLGLIQGQTPFPIVAPFLPVHLQFVSHTLLLCWILAAAFIDIDERIVPDEITVTGTLLGLTLAALVPMSLLPNVEERPANARGEAPAVRLLLKQRGVPAVGLNGLPLFLEPVTAVAPEPWPPSWGRARTFPALAAGLGCYWLWCFALAPRIWRGRRGRVYALWIISRRVTREFLRPPLRWMLVAGTAAVVIVWAISPAAWAGLLSSLLGLVGSGGIVWAVRIIGTAALRKEAMGFGDVTLMMMMGTFLGWQACLMTFFLAPFAALVIGILQFILRRDDALPYVPYLCLAAVGVVLFWAPIWSWARELFGAGPLVPFVLIVCLALLGIMLFIWRIIKTALFGRSSLDDRETEDTETTEH
jgi:prepilin signal peptidase PulO-like enzyme (type II secretory pathway)